MSIISSSGVKTNKVLLVVFIILLILNLILIVQLISNSISKNEEKLTGTSASDVVVEKTTNTIKVWSSLISDHDLRALVMMSDKAKQRMLATTDPTLLEKQVNTKFKIKIYDISNVRVFDGGTIAARVSFSGFYIPLGYQTMELRFRDDGTEYMKIQDVQAMPTVFPKGEKVAELRVNFVPGGIANLSTTSIKGEGFIVLKVANKDNKIHVVVIVKPGTDPTNVANILSQVFAGPGGNDEMAIVGLPKGDYEVFDIAKDVKNIGTFTVK